ncbi:MAG TPA: prolipoprotein diacylglyceryl transferase [Trebonia sp.]|jgi:prolipoprotein diacylglyceryl transferase
MVHASALPLYIPSPPINGFHIGPLDIHFYALGYIVGIIFAILITRRRWAAIGGDPDLVADLALWVVPAGIIGGRIYFDITTPDDIPHVWYGVFAIWTGGLGIWGGVILATLVGVWRLKRVGITAGAFGNAIAPALLVAQGIGRIGNYFNKELFGGPTTLPWGLEIPYQYRVAGGIPEKYWGDVTFQPSFLYELIWDILFAVFLIWLGRRVKMRPWALFALYVAGYSAYRIFEESIRVDSSEYFFGMRLNFWVAIFGTVAGLIWFAIAQRRPERPIVVRAATADSAADEAAPGDTAPGDTSAGAAGDEDAGTGAEGHADAPEPEARDDQQVPAGDAAPTVTGGDSGGVANGRSDNEVTRLSWRPSRRPT